jgi:cytochrome c biogenesis protein CcdA
MAVRRGMGLMLAFLTCPCHLPLYAIAIGLLGGGAAISQGWLLTGLLILFATGLAILLFPAKDPDPVAFSTTADASSQS